MRPETITGVERISFRLPPAIMKQFVRACNRLCVSKSDQLRDLVVAFIKAEEAKDSATDTENDA